MIAPLAVKVAEFPKQTVGEEGLIVMVGFGLTVINSVEFETQPKAFVPLTV